MSAIYSAIHVLQFHANCIRSNTVNTLIYSVNQLNKELIMNLVLTIFKSIIFVCIAASLHSSSDLVFCIISCTCLQTCICTKLYYFIVFLVFIVLIFNLSFYVSIHNSYSSEKKCLKSVNKMFTEFSLPAPTSTRM